MTLKELVAKRKSELGLTTQQAKLYVAQEVLLIKINASEYIKVPDVIFEQMSEFENLFKTDSSLIKSIKSKHVDPTTLIATYHRIIINIFKIYLTSLI